MVAVTRGLSGSRLSFESGHILHLAVLPARTATASQAPPARLERATFGLEVQSSGAHAPPQHI